MDPLAVKISEFVQNCAAENAEATFEALALTLFARQYECCAPYRRLCDQQGQTPQTVRQWQDIPSVPAQAFKVFDLSCAPILQTVSVFHSSGTTGSQTSKHYFDADGITLYETSLRAGFEAALPEGPSRIWALMPDPERAPHSSLSHMLGALNAERFYWDNDAALAMALSQLTEPIVLFGTAFAFVQLFDGTNTHWNLPFWKPSH